MRLLTAVALLSLLCASTAEAGKKGGKGTIVLDGEKTSVRWSDGDSFSFLAGPHKGKGTRLLGFNTLEAYGPVHRWGSWTGAELYEIALGCSKLGPSREWECHWSGKSDGYGRLLISCPELAKEMVRQGQALVFEVEGKADPAILALQQEAKEKKLGIWAKGAPSKVITSAHSITEGTGYNRVVDTRTGAALEDRHQRSYQTCEEVCVGKGEDSSCLIYVPFERRYRDRPDCLRPGKRDGEEPQPRGQPASPEAPQSSNPAE